MLKRCFTLLIAICFLLSSSISIQAVISSSTDEEYAEYLGYFNQGYLGDDVTFEVWKNLRDSSYELEASLNSLDAFELVYDSSCSAYANYSMKAGDVFVTNGTSSLGILGHAAIAISSSLILHIAGPGENPTTITLATWHSNYTNYDASDSWTKVYRHSNSSIATQAAEWAENTYRGSSASYYISQDVTSTTMTYCSKIVWQAYYFGPDTTDATYLPSGYILPYNVANLIGDVSLIQSYVGS